MSKDCCWRDPQRWITLGTPAAAGPCLYLSLLRRCGDLQTSSWLCPSSSRKRGFSVNEFKHHSSQQLHCQNSGVAWSGEPKEEARMSFLLRSGHGKHWLWLSIGTWWGPHEDQGRKALVLSQCRSTKPAQDCQPDGKAPNRCDVPRSRNEQGVSDGYCNVQRSLWFPGQCMCKSAFI